MLAADRIGGRYVPNLVVIFGEAIDLAIYAALTLAHDTSIERFLRKIIDLGRQYSCYRCCFVCWV